LLLAALEVFAERLRQPRLTGRALIRFAACFTELGHAQAQACHEPCKWPRPQSADGNRLNGLGSLARACALWQGSPRDRSVISPPIAPESCCRSSAAVAQW